MGTGNFPWGKAVRPEVNTRFHLVPKLEMSGTIPLLPLYTFLVLTGKTLPFSVVWSMILYNTEDHNMNLYFYAGIMLFSGSEVGMADDDGDMSREASPCEESCESYSVGNVTHQEESLSTVVSQSNSLMFRTNKVTVATQTGHEAPDLTFNPEKMTTDKHCYECKVRYRDPKPRDLVMYLHAWKYKV